MWGLDHCAVTQAVNQQAAHVGAGVDHNLVPDCSGREADVVDDGGADLVALDDLKHAAGGVDAAHTVSDVEQHHHGVQGLEGGDLLGGLGAVNLNGQAGGALWQLHAPSLVRLDGVLEGVQGHGTGQGVSGQHGSRHNGVHRHLLQPPQGAAALSIRGGGDLAHDDGVAGGNVLEGHAHNQLGTQLLVQELGLLELLHVDDGEDGTVTVQQATEVVLLALNLLGQVTHAAAEGVGVPGLLLKGGNTQASAAGGLAEAGQPVAGVNLVLRVLSQGHADGVAQPVHQQGSDTNGGLHAAVLALTGLCYPQVQGVVPALLVHLLGQQAVGLDHDQGVGGLHAEHKVVVVVLAADVGKLKGALHHTLGSIAIVAQDPSRQAAVVGSNAHSTAQILALLHQRREHLLNVIPLRCELCGVIVVDGLKGLAAVCKVAGVDTDLLEAFSHHHGNSRLEVDIRYKGYIIPILEKLLTDLIASLCLPLALDCDAHNVCTSVSTLLHLVHGCLDIPCVSGCHRLQCNAVLAAHLHFTNMDSAGWPALGLMN
mmetsp:Transcript_28469/g.62659  ORF Transcript_28469/g.62659 Transcript_28469/m.62659 type:complete len:540 (-) Transcript_28469:255-1874(-)